MVDRDECTVGIRRRLHGAWGSYQGGFELDGKTLVHGQKQGTDRSVTSFGAHYPRGTQTLKTKKEPVPAQDDARASWTPDSSVDWTGATGPLTRCEK